MLQTIIGYISVYFSSWANNGPLTSALPMWRDVILANISTMLPCTGAARSGSYRGAKILGKSREPMTKLNFGLAVHSLIKSRSKHKVLLVFYCSMHLSCFSPPPKEVMQKCTITYDSDPEQHPQTKLLQSLLWLLLKRWNCHCERYFSPQWALAGRGQILPHCQGGALRNWKLREPPRGCF